MSSTQGQDNERRRQLAPIVPEGQIMAARGWFLSTYEPEEVVVPLSSLESLPIEVLENIIERLVVSPPIYQVNSHQDFEYMKYEWSKRTLHSLCLTSRRLGSVACLILYRVLHLTEPEQLVAAWRQIRQNPRLASYVNHIVCHLDLIAPNTTETVKNHPLLRRPFSVVRRPEYVRLRGKDRQLWTIQASTTETLSLPQHLFFDLISHTVRLETLSLSFPGLRLLNHTTAPFVPARVQQDYLYRFLYPHISNPGDWCIDPDLTVLERPGSILQGLTQLRLQVKDWGSFVPFFWMKAANLRLQRVEMVGTGRIATEYWGFDLKSTEPSDQIPLGNRIAKMELSKPHMTALHHFFDEFTPAVRSIRFINPVAVPPRPADVYFFYHYNFNRLLRKFHNSLELLYLDWTLPNETSTSYYCGGVGYMDSIFYMRHLQSLTISLNLLFKNIPALREALGLLNNEDRDDDEDDNEEDDSEPPIKELIDRLPYTLTNLKIREWWGNYNDPNRDLSDEENGTFLLMKALVKYWLLVAPPGERKLRLQPYNLFKWAMSQKHKDLQVAFPSIRAETSFGGNPDDPGCTFEFTRKNSE